MSRNIVKSTVTQHAKHRIQERSPVVSLKELAKALKFSAHKIQYIKRLTNTRSMIYIKLSTGYVKAIINRKNKTLITVLPWCDKRKVKMNIKYGGKRWVCTIYPDAMREANRPIQGTKIEAINNDGTREKPSFKSDEFLKIFKATWNLYNARNKSEESK